MGEGKSTEDGGRRTEDWAGDIGKGKGMFSDVVPPFRSLSPPLTPLTCREPHHDGF